MLESCKPWESRGRLDSRKNCGLYSAPYPRKQKGTSACNQQMVVTIATYVASILQTSGSYAFNNFIISTVDI